MELKEIASISGKPGLYKIIKPTYNGVIVESLDAKKVKSSVGAAHRVSILKEVSIYTTDKEGSIALEEVLHKIHTQYQDKLELHNKSPKEALEAFLEEIVPTYDRERVYASDMKKLVNWYNILSEHSPETLENLMKEDAEDNPAEPETPAEEVQADLKAQEISEGPSVEAPTGAKAEKKKEKPSSSKSQTGPSPEESKSEKAPDNPVGAGTADTGASAEAKPKKKRRRPKKSSPKE